MSALGEGQEAGDAGVAAASERVDGLLDIALELFARKDFKAVSIKELAKASGVSTSLIYYYFENKRHLFDAAAEHAIREALTSYRNMVRRHRSPVDRINDWFQVNVAMQDSLRFLSRIMFNYAGNSGETGLVEDKVVEFYDFERGLLAEGIARGIAEGLFRRVDPARLARFVSIHLDGIFHASMVQRDLNLAGEVEDLKNALWQMLGYEERSGRTGPASGTGTD